MGDLMMGPKPFVMLAEETKVDLIPSLQHHGSTNYYCYATILHSNLIFTFHHLTIFAFHVFAVHSQSDIPSC